MTLLEITQKIVDGAYYATHPDTIALISSALGATITVLLLVAVHKAVKLLNMILKVRVKK